MNVAFLGTGLMGFPMARRLLNAGEDVIAYNRTRAKAEPLHKDGARIVDSPQDAIAAGDCVILMLSDARAVQDVLLAGESVDLADKTVIQMGTIAPEESIEFQKKVYKYGGEYFECPVLGSKNEAAAGELILMVGASEEKFQNWEMFLKIFGPHPRHIGDVGKAAALKLALNHLIAAHAASFSLSLGLVLRNGVDVDHLMSILRESSLYAPMFDRKLNNWLEGDFDNPNFPTKHLLKDVELIIKAASQQNLRVEVVEAIAQLLRDGVKKKGLADQDYSSVFKVVND